MSDIIFEKEKQQLVIRFKCCHKIEVKDAACTLKTLNDDEKMVEVSSDKCVHITMPKPAYLEKALLKSIKIIEGEKYDFNYGHVCRCFIVDDCGLF
ncbi:MAG: hypothetical protein ABIL66_08865 [candidate division WOR-3 bacterium]